MKHGDNRGRGKTPAPEFLKNPESVTAPAWWGVWLQSRWHITAGGVWYAPARAIAEAQADHLRKNGQPDAVARAFGE